ncbi:MAG: hypothetical protein AB7G28_16740 [Pirellulales bacterium]
MKYCTFFAALLALSNWTFVTTSQAWAHGGTDLSIAKCDCEDEEEEGDDSGRVIDCEDEEGDDGAAVLECHDEDDAE